jgi:hypothetical protein
VFGTDFFPPFDQNMAIWGQQQDESLLLRGKNVLEGYTAALMIRHSKGRHSEKNFSEFPRGLEFDYPHYPQKPAKPA